MPDEKQTLLRKIPAVDRLLISPALKEVSRLYPRGLVLKAIHRVLDELRTMTRQGVVSEEMLDLNMQSISERVVKRLRSIAQPSLRPVINATGVVVHTNLGRSILAETVLTAFKPLSGRYTNLEYNLDKGERGSRYTHVEEILEELTGAEASMVVNNNAAAVFISLNTLAKEHEVVVSRGQLVEIGGSFRIPDVMRNSGAKMVEVGTTNKTHLGDYEEALNTETALLLKVHTSNFQVVGFTKEVPLSELVKLGRQHEIPVMEDLGSGCLVDFSSFGLIKEPTVQDALAHGADLVTFSGDKLLGGPQAGIILGRKDLIDKIKKNQLTRVLRIDKLTLLALEQTLRLYRDEEDAVRKIPTLKMMFQPYKSLARKAERLLRRIGSLDPRNFSLKLMDGSSRPGGGALPLLELPTRLLCLVPGRLSSQHMESWLRSYDPPIITRIEKKRVLLDVRTIQEKELTTLAEAIHGLAATDQVNKSK